MKNTWKKWITITKKVVNIQANILLILFYVVFIIPTGIFLQLFFKNALLGHRHSRGSNTYWIKRKIVKQDVSFAWEQ